MRSAIGVNSVRATLEKSLLRAQKRFNLSNPSSAAKETRWKEKNEERKVQKKLQHLARQNRLLFGSDVPDDQVAADWRDLLVNPVQLEFEPAADCYEEFINQFESQFSRFSKGTVKSRINSSLPLKSVTSAESSKKGIKGESKKLRKLRKILKRAKLAANLNDQEDDEVALIKLDSSSKSKLELRKERRQRIRKIQKAIKKEAQRLRDEAKDLEKRIKAEGCLLLKKVKKRKMKDMMVNCGGGGGSEVLASPGHSGLDSKTKVTAKVTLISNGIVKKEPQLPKPKFTIFPREKVQLGWTQKYPAGCGFINAGNSCYMNATLQAVFHIPSFVNWLLSDNTHQRQCQSSQKYQQCMVCSMKNTLVESLDGRQCMRPSQIHSKLRLISQNFVYGRQEDAHEFLRHLLESMEVSYLRACGCTNYDTRSKETTPLGQIFGGYLRTEVTCLKCHHVSTTFQPLAELQLDIRHATSVAEAVAFHFRKEKVDNNDYKCEGCRAVVPVMKQFSLELPPVVLCLQLKRFTLFGGKLSKAIQCNRELDMTNFLHSSLSSQYPKNLKYRMVSLITHIGSSPNGGHYTAIAGTSTGALYQFDDSYVRSVPAHSGDSVSTDAYVIIYEMVDSSRDTKHGVPSTSPNAQIRNKTPPITVNGFSTQRFPKPSTVTSATAAAATITNNGGPPKPLKFVFNQCATKLGNPFASTSMATPEQKPQNALTKALPNGIAKVANPVSNGSIANKVALPTEVKAKNERIPISFTLKNVGVENIGSKIVNYRPTPSTTGLKSVFTSKLESKICRSPKRDDDRASSVVQSSNNPKSLVPYDDDSLDSPGRNSRERSATPKNNGAAAEPVKKFDANLVSTPIKGWNDSTSLLATTTEAGRKRDLESSRADLFNEELDAGRTKKPKLDPTRLAGRDNPGINKFQNYEDQRRIVNERTKSLTSPIRQSSISAAGFTKDPYRSHHQGNSNGGKTYDTSGSCGRPTYSYNGQQSAKQNQARYGDNPFQFRANNQDRGNSSSGGGYQSHGGFKRYNSAPSSFGRFNDNRSHHRGGGGSRGGPRGNPGNRQNYYNNKSRNTYNNYYRSR